jgi:hypothetical protein
MLPLIFIPAFRAAKIIILPPMSEVVSVFYEKINPTARIFNHKVLGKALIATSACGQGAHQSSQTAIQQVDDAKPYK